MLTCCRQRREQIIRRNMCKAEYDWEAEGIDPWKRVQDNAGI